MSRSLQEIMKEITDWQDRIFTKATPLSAAIHLQREINELLADLCYGKPVGGNYSENVAAEIADIFLLTIAVAHLSGIDLEVAVAEKMAVNQMREWGKPDADGVVEHVRDAQPMYEGEHPQWKGKTLLEVFTDEGLIPEAPDGMENILIRISKGEDDGTL